MDDIGVPDVPQNGVVIRCFRLKDGWTQKALAQQVKITPGALSAIESEKHPASEVVINRLARELKVPTVAITHRVWAKTDTAEQVAA